jgi:hypothetical protein
MFNLNNIQETTKYFADQFTTYAVAKDAKEFTKKSQEFTVSLIDAQYKATIAAFDAIGAFAGTESTTYLDKAKEVVNTVTENAKEIIQTGTFKSATHAGHKK